MKHILQWVARRSEWTIITMAAALAMALGIVDLRVSPAASFMVFYVLLAAAVAWRVDASAGMFLALISTIMMTMTDMLMETPPSVSLLCWNVAMRVGVFAFTTYLVCRLKHSHDDLERRVQERTDRLRALNEELAASKTQLEAQANILKSICNSIGDGIIVCDMDGKFLLFTQAAESLIGIGAQDVPAERWAEVYGIYCTDKVTPFPSDQLPLRRALRGEECHAVELYVRNEKVPEGAFISVTARPLVTEKGERFGGVAAIRNITKRKQTEHALQRSYALLEAVIEGTTDSIFVTDTAGRYLFVNSAWAESMHRTKAAAIGQPKRELLPRGVALELESDDRLVLKTGETITTEVNLYNGEEERTCLVTKGAFRDHDGAIAGLFGIARDITGRKREEETLRESEAYYRLLFENNPDPMYVCDEETLEFLSVNKAAIRHYGWSRDEFLKMRVTDIRPMETVPALMDRMSQLRTSRQLFESVNAGFWQHCKKDGSVIEVEITRTAIPYKSHPALLVHVRDVTERRRTELRLSTQYAVTNIIAESRSVEKAMPAILEVICSRLNWALGECWLAEDRGQQLHRVGLWTSHEEVMQETPPSPLKPGEGLPGQVWVENQPTWATNFSLRWRDYQSKTAQRLGLNAAFAFPLAGGREALGVITLYSREQRTPDSELLQIFAAIGSQVGQFIARKAVEEARRAQAQVFASLVEGVCLSDESGVISLTNPALDKTFGYEPGELVGQHVSVLNSYPPEQSKRMNQEIVEYLNANELWGGEFLNRRKDGTEFFSEARINRISLAGRTFYVSVQQDITERKRLQKEILEISDREQARIGHDLHDGLCQHLVSVAFAANTLENKLAARELPEASDVREISSLIDDAITQARNTARGLYPVDIETEGLASALQALADHISTRHDIDCAVESPARSPAIDAATGVHLYRIAQEAVNNAIKHAACKNILIRLAESDNHIELSIHDDGIGIRHTLNSAQGMGLHIMRYRTRTIGGALNIRERREGGTIIACSLSQKLVLS